MNFFSWAPLNIDFAGSFRLSEWTQNLSSDRVICQTCPAHFCQCQAECSVLAGHFVQHDSIHIKCSTRKIRMTTDIYQSATGKNEQINGAQNFRQSAEGLPNVLSGKPDIILLITDLSFLGR